MTNNLSKLSIIVMSVLMANAAAAIDGNEIKGVDQLNSGNDTINAGGFVIKPAVTLAVGYNDNVGLVSDALHKDSSTFVQVTPKVSIDMPIRGQVYSATYAGNYANYTSSTHDNYSDYNLGLAAENNWDTRLNSLINYDYQAGHDARNSLPFASGNGQLITIVPSENWHTNGLKGMVHYGAQGAQGQVELAAGLLEKRYDSNNSGVTQTFDHDEINFNGDFYFKIAPSTQMIFEAGATKYSYIDAVTSNKLNSTEQQYLVGVKWDATAKTSGTIKLGSNKKSFDSGFNPSNSSTAWDANVTWMPLTYSVVNFRLAKHASESYNVGSFIVSRDSTVNWAHQWQSRLKSTLMANKGTDTYQNTNQEFKRDMYSAQLSYEINRWLNAGIKYQYMKRDASSSPALSYTQNLSMLVIDGTL
jgi:hypothetical protein